MDFDTTLTHLTHKVLANGIQFTIPKVCSFVSFFKQNAHAMFVWIVDAPGTVSSDYQHDDNV
jgi:hypothetical protein